jgi:acyl-CoA thioester hydrolase
MEGMTTTNGEKGAFVVPFQAQWSDMDQNGHMRTTAYLGAAEDSRMRFFAANGFSVGDFTRLGIGPVVQTDEIRYRAELRLLDRAHLEIQLAGLSSDGARFGLRNIFTREDGKTACTVTTFGGWLDLRERRLAPAPGDLLTVLEAMVRTDDFAELSSPLTGRPA